jgi:hypothetical protein
VLVVVDMAVVVLVLLVAAVLVDALVVAVDVGLVIVATPTTKRRRGLDFFRMASVVTAARRRSDDVRGGELRANRKHRVGTAAPSA